MSAIPPAEKTSNEKGEKTPQSLSQVGKKNNKRANFWWLMAFLSVFVFYGLLKACTHHSADASKTLSNNNVTDQAEANMRAMEARAKEIEKQEEARQQEQSQEVLGAAGGGDNNNAAYNKVYLARLNAPTTVYEADSSNSSSTNASVPGGTVEVQKDTTNTNNAFIGRDANSQFLNNAGNAPPVVQANQITHPDFTIVQGTLIHASLESAIDSDLPGMVRAVVSEPVYAYDGSHVLIPKGSRLIGQYTSSVVQGQNRVFIIWNRVIRPDAISVMLNSPDTDTLGRAGEGADSIQTHFFARFGEAGLLSIIGAGASNAGVQDSSQLNSAAAYRVAMAQSFAQSAQQSLQNTLPIKPTLHVYQGHAINVFVARDLSFYAVLNPQPADESVPTSTLPLTQKEVQKLKALASN